MVTFNVDSLDFSDGEAIRTGADDDFSTRYSSANDRLEIEDLTNATVGHVPRGTSTDLVGGKYAETLSEGEALADNGEVYESIQEAVNNASSFVRVGPGDFRESVTIDKAGFTLVGSGRRTVIQADVLQELSVSAARVTIANLSVVRRGSDRDADVVSVGGDNFTGRNIYAEVNGVVDDRFTINFNGITGGVVSNCTSVGPAGIHIVTGTKSVVRNCEVDGVGIKVSGRGRGINSSGDDNVLVNNTIKNVFGSGNEAGIKLFGNDTITIGNRIDNCSRGIFTNNNSAGHIVANNRISNSEQQNIRDDATGTVLDGNLTT